MKNLIQAGKVCTKKGYLEILKPKTERDKEKNSEDKEKTKEDVQTVIDKDVKTAYNNAKIIAETYGNLYERDLSSNMYKVENTDTFFLTQDGYVYNFSSVIL